MRSGMPSLLKQGTKHYTGKHAVVLKDIEACKALFTITRTSFGPHGMKKMVINRHDRLFVTSDASTIMQELEVEHPAAKILVLACTMMQQEIGDGSNFVLVLAGELLSLAESLIQMGLHTTDIIRGYTLARDYVLGFAHGKAYVQ
jgi:T-complex protein 1 subunit theta